MTYSQSRSIIDWLIVQRQMLSVWLSDTESAQAKNAEAQNAETKNAAAPSSSLLAAKLHEHDQWLAQSIDELRSAA